MNSIAPISVAYDHAVARGYLAPGDGLSYLVDVQEGLVKDGHGANSTLATFIVAVRTLAPKPSLQEIGDMLRKVGQGVLLDPSGIAP